MRPAHRKRVIMIGVALAVAAAAVLAAYGLPGSAPATTRHTAPIWLSTADTTSAGGALYVSGGIDGGGDLSGAVIKLYKREVGSNTSTYSGRATVTYSLMTGNVFSGVIPALRRNCIVTARWAGNARYFGSRTWMFAGVSPRLTVTAPVATQQKTEIRIGYSPRQPLHHQGVTKPPFLARVQCRVDGVWTDFPVDSGTFSTDLNTYCAYEYVNVPAGTYTVRAQFVGTNSNIASVSKATEIVVP